MSDKTILLLGANGQLGFESQKALPALGTVVALDFPDIDFGQPDTLRAIVRKYTPSIIVNTAAYTAVDKAESNAAAAEAVNALAPGVLAEEAEALGAILVHYSTDYVFDGTKPAPYVETDAPNPLSVYGRTKRAGEAAVGACRKHLIFRTSWVVGAHGNNFIKTMLKLAKEREALRVVADQYGAPTSAKLLAEATTAVLKIMQGAAVDDDRWGLYHLVAGGATSWNGLARHIIALAATSGVALKAKPEAVAEITTADYPTPAKRPANSRLDTAKLQRAFSIVPPDWAVGVDDVLDRILEVGV